MGLWERSGLQLQQSSRIIPPHPAGLPKKSEYVQPSGDTPSPAQGKDPHRGDSFSQVRRTRFGDMPAPAQGKDPRSGRESPNPVRRPGARYLNRLTLKEYVQSFADVPDVRVRRVSFSPQTEMKRGSVIPRMSREAVNDFGNVILTSIWCDLS